MKFTTIVAVLAGLISKTDGVIINQTMASVSRQANLTKEGAKSASKFDASYIRDQVAVETSSVIKKNETKNDTIAHNASSFGNTRQGNEESSGSAVQFIPSQ